MAIDITLSKLKFRNPDFRTLRRQGIDTLPEGTRVYKAGRFGSKSSNGRPANAPKDGQTLRPRRRAWGPW